MAKLTTPKLRVLLADPAMPDDEGAEHTVRVLNVDMVAFDRDRSRFGWPTADAAPFLWLTYLAWKALQRTGQIPSMPLAEFETKCLSVESRDGEATEVDPTQSAAAPA